MTDDDDDGDTVMDVLLREMRQDDTDESHKLIKFYEEVGEREKGVINRVLIYCCGWSLPTLIKKTTDPEAEAHDVPYLHD